MASFSNDIFLQAAGLILQAVVGFSTLFLFKWAIMAKSALGKLANTINGKISTGTVNSVKERVNRGVKFRQQTKELSRQKAFLDRAASGAGIRGRGFKIMSALSMSPRNRGKMYESIFDAQEQLRQKQHATVATAIGRSGGAVLAADMARMTRGETVDQYEARVKKAGTKGKNWQGFDEEQRAALELARQRFGSQIGSSDFRIGALMAAHRAGSEVVDVRAATQELAEQLKDETGVFATNNVMLETLGKSAKEGGFAGLAYAGLDSDGTYSDFAIKLPKDPVTGRRVANASTEPEGADSTVLSMSLDGMEKGQLAADVVDPLTGKKTLQLTTLGLALARAAGKDKAVWARRIAGALSQPKAKHTRELELAATQAGIWPDVEGIIKRV